MTDYPLTINGTDFRWIANKYGYKTNLQPVYGKSYTNLNYVTRKKLVRNRGVLSIDTNFFTQEELNTLFTQLNQGIVSVYYYNNKLGGNVVQTMEVNSGEIENRFKNFKTLGVVTFTEL